MRMKKIREMTDEEFRSYVSIKFPQEILDNKMEIKIIDFLKILHINSELMEEIKVLCKTDSERDVL